jgi:hypothetical protein
MSTKRVTSALAALLLGSATLASAQTPRIDVTLFDAPYNTERGVRAPSMQQSLDLSTARYEGLHGGIEKLFGKRKRLGRVAIVFADLATTVEVALPISSVWVHEEFHRAAMGRRGIDSHDDVYDFNIGSDWIAVSHVRDEDLARLKREHPAEWVRVNEAGIEGELMLVRDLERRRFFGQSRAWHLPLYWITKLGTIGYVQSGSWDDADGDVDQMNVDDGANVARRDFTGHDFLGWVYDLHRPHEAYEARGLHPSGVGIDRYRKRSHLTDAERAYLKKMGRMQLLNLADPFLFGVNDGIAVGKGVRLTAGLSDYLTSFGDTIDTSVLARRGDTKVAMTIHAYRNGERSFPGADVELLDHAVTAAGRSWQVSPRIALWTQPKDQRFDTRESSLGALAGVRVRTAVTRRFGAFVDVETKSAGWVAGSAYLDRNTSVRVGVSAMAW